MTPILLGDRITVMDSSWDSYRNYIAEQIRHEQSLLFQRFNYFLLITSFLIIAFITVLASDIFAWINPQRLYWIAQTIAIVGILLSYSFSLVNLLNARLINDMGFFLNNVNCSWTRYFQPHFMFHVSYILVPKYRFGIKNIFEIHYHFWVFIKNLIKRSGKTENLSYYDLAPHTWLTPLFITFVWIGLYSITFLDYLWLLPAVAVILSFVICIGVKYWGKRRCLIIWIKKIKWAPKNR